MLEKVSIASAVHMSKNHASRRVKGILVVEHSIVSDLTILSARSLRNPVRGKSVEDVSQVRDLLDLLVLGDGTIRCVSQGLLVG